MTTKDIGGIFGYKQYTTGIFYRRLNSMLSYGLIEQVGRGNFKVSILGEGLAYPENDQKERELKTKAVLNVPLWNEIYKKHAKHPPSDSFWVLLKNITGIDPAEAQKNQSLISKWYNEDISNVLDEYVESKPSSKSLTKNLSPSESTNTILAQQLADQEKLEFGKAVLLLPKKDLIKEWEKLQKYMEIFLEDYKEPVKSEEKPQE